MMGCIVPTAFASRSGRLSIARVIFVSLSLSYVLVVTAIPNEAIPDPVPRMRFKCGGVARISHSARGHGVTNRRLTKVAAIVALNLGA
jgi:hypothetical protein